MDNSQKQKEDRSFKEKAVDGWKLLKQLASEWALEVYSNKKRLILIGVAFIFCLVLFLRGLVLMLFF
jgi:hypothetical protein